MNSNRRPAISHQPSAISRIRTFLDMIRFEHTIFALPFAYLGMALAARGLPTLWQFIWITIAMAAARTAAMSLNRYIDRFIDSRNPRTAKRPIQAGRIGANTVLAGAILSLVILAAAAWQLNPLVFILFPGAVVFLVGYSYTKRFTALCHFILGFTDGLAPMGAWAAITGTVFARADLPAWLLLGVVTVWIGGFDILYALQDAEVDRREGLHSLPAWLGIPTGLWIARLCHALTVALLIAVGLVSALGWPYWIGVATVAGLLLYEHSLVTPTDLSKLNVAFFNVNGYISVTIFVATLVALLLVQG
ncbi:MAG: UbiA family prenyltransferase [Chloroflexi bacterium]|nr:UbiA family prenyltransferase [Chloroflexota bacterium]